MQKFISFGTWRFVLAFLVAISHLWAGMIHGYAAYAVWAFYVLSGYLMTYVLIHKYGFSSEGLQAYGYNRFIRIMPSYWVALILGVITLWMMLPLGFDPSMLNPAFKLPHGLQWFFNLALIPSFDESALAVPVAKALSIEICAYMIIPLLARYKQVAWVTLVLSSLLNAKLQFTIESFPERYSSLLPCLLTFSLGALVAHNIETLKRFASPTLSCSIWFIHGLIWIKFDQWPWTYGLYSSIILSAWVIISLDARRTSKFDQFLGDLSYPIYLFHTTVAAWLLPFYGLVA